MLTNLNTTQSIELDYDFLLTGIKLTLLGFHLMMI
jgi:hypothetical protein